MAITGSTFMKVSRAQRLDVSGHAMDRIAHHTGLHPTEALAPGGGYVFNTIHNIQGDVPPGNIVAMYEALEECGAY